MRRYNVLIKRRAKLPKRVVKKFGKHDRYRRFRVYRGVGSKLNGWSTSKDHAFKVRNKLNKGRRKRAIVRPAGWIDGAKADKSSGDLTIINRTSWGARQARGVVYTSWSPSQTIRVHHTVSTPRGSHAQFMRETQAYHMDSRGYSDVGYNYIIMPDGTVYEGRGANIVGAHTLNHNHDIGVAFAGNFELASPTDAAVDAFHKLRAKLTNGKGSVYPHSKTYSTACPGKLLKLELGL